MAEKCRDPQQGVFATPSGGDVNGCPQTEHSCVWVPCSVVVVTSLFLLCGERLAFSSRTQKRMRPCAHLCDPSLWRFPLSRPICFRAEVRFVIPCPRAGKRTGLRKNNCCVSLSTLFKGSETTRIASKGFTRAVCSLFVRYYFAFTTPFAITLGR
jgi:hypothetical protein